jgi:hypothetical protein
MWRRRRPESHRGPSESFASVRKALAGGSLAATGCAATGFGAPLAPVCGVIGALAGGFFGQKWAESIAIAAFSPGMAPPPPGLCGRGCGNFEALPEDVQANYCGQENANEGWCGTDP